MPPSCPVCGSHQFNDFFTANTGNKQSFRLVTCGTCSHHFTLIPDHIDLSTFYEDDDYKVADFRKSLFFRLLSFEYTGILKKISEIRQGSESLLDFGCGKGNFLWFAKNQGWSSTGVETSLPRAEYARNIFDLTVFTENYSSGKIGTGSYDVITLFHVLEHLPAPVELLRELVSGNLNKNGILLIEVPNFASWQARWTMEKWMHLDIPRHISHFSEPVLMQILQLLNLNPVKKEYFSFHLGVLGMVQSIMSILGYRNNLLT
ncbi:MAG: class I SAM-dependent methyltransferase, partial [Bacteroidetes bacterium]|nr:class I SAM-dependent methyltransferase [Bacteroidota bacterium]